MRGGTKERRYSLGMAAGGGLDYDAYWLRRALQAASRRHEAVDLGEGQYWDLPADVVRSLCHEHAAEVDPFGLRVRHARIVGALDLSAVHVPFPLHFDSCQIDGHVDVAGAQLHALAIVGSRVPGILANGVRIQRDLDLSGTRLDGALETSASQSHKAAVWLTEAEIGGRFLCVGTVIEGEADRAIQADRTRFGGAVRLIHGFRTDGELRLLAIHLAGSLDLTGASLRPKNLRALDLGDAHIQGGLFVIEAESKQGATRSEIIGRIELGHATVGGRVLIRNATLRAPGEREGGHHYLPAETLGRTALYAPRLTVVGDLIVEGSSRIEGGLDLTMAEIKGSLRLDHQTVENAHDRALDLTNASVSGDLSAIGLDAQGTTHLTGGHIAGSLLLEGARLSRPPLTDRRHRGSERSAVLSADGATIDRDLDLRSLDARGGGLWFRSARIGGSVDLTDARLDNPPGRAASFPQAQIAGTVRLAGDFTALGLVAFNHATVGGRIVCTGARLSWPGASGDPAFNRFGAAFEAINAQVAGGLELDWREVTGIVDLTGAHTPSLTDDPRNWGHGVRLSGFTYDRFATSSPDNPADTGSWAVDDRVDWLSRQLPFDIGPFEQAARVYRQHGRNLDAENMLIHGRRLARRQAAPDGSGRGSVAGHLRRSGDWFLDRAVGYGYRPSRVGAFLIMLAAITALLLALPAGTETLRATSSTGQVYRPTSAASGTGPATGPGAVRADRCGAGQVRCFQPILYSIDTVVPLIDLGQRSTWYPTQTGAGWFYAIWLNVATILGWVASTIFLLAFARLART